MQGELDVADCMIFISILAHKIESIFATNLSFFQIGPKRLRLQYLLTIAADTIKQLKKQNKLKLRVDLPPWFMYLKYSRGYPVKRMIFSTVEGYY